MRGRCGVQQFPNGLEKNLPAEWFLKKLRVPGCEVFVAKQPALSKFREAEPTDEKQSHKRLQRQHLPNNGGPVTSCKNNVGNEQIDVFRHVAASGYDALLVLA